MFKKQFINKCILTLLYREAEKSANQTCPFIHGQPVLPKTVKALKKNE